MKKKYMAPAQRIYNVQTENMMALSTNSTTIKGDDISSGAYTIDVKEEQGWASGW